MKMRSMTLAVILGCFLILGSAAIVGLLFLATSGTQVKTSAIKSSSDSSFSPSLKLKIRILTLENPKLTLEMGTLDRDTGSLDPLFELREADLKKALEKKAGELSPIEIESAFRGDERDNPLYKEINTLLQRSPGETVVFTLGRKR